MANNESGSSVQRMDIEGCISMNTSSRTFRAIPPDVSPSENMLDAIRFILVNNTYEKNNATLTVYQEQIFEIIEQLRECPQKMFMYLCKHFAQHFDIDLYIIAFDNGKFSVLNKDNYNKKNMAFLSFNENNTVRGPLYITSCDGTNETVFSINNDDIRLDVYIYVTQLNGSKSSTDFLQIQEQQTGNHIQESIENSLINNTLASKNQLDPSYPIQVDEKTQSRIVLDHTLQQFFRIIDNLPLHSHTIYQILQPFVSNIATVEHLSPSDSVIALKDGSNCLSELIHMAEQSMSIPQNDQVEIPQFAYLHQVNNQGMDVQNQTLSNAETLLNTSLPTAISAGAVDANNSPIENLMNVTENYNSPTIIKPLKNKSHPRTLREFAATGSSPIQCDKSGQRDSLPIGVPPDDDNSLYLGIEVVDLNDQNHPSKIIVPDKTKAKDKSLINTNDLRCLDFSKCHKDYMFDHDTKHLYSKISSEERQAQQKK